MTTTTLTSRRRIAVGRHRSGAITRGGFARPRPGAAPSSLCRRLADDRGDVPGWVLITLMTAAIVVTLWAVASEQIVQIFENAMAPFLNRQL
ncbi:hypothetical protein JSY14_02765 [Brachybacterium sp. EF45031]|uniref:hypothetical protein n=1 Tax=Brachybacterium sillae TaxID=2810536 RepID=UPI00217DFBD7|nr:hypothetical protein [Brachybacterium sillae]MCS6710988.1 hypothetical protein [Brachybacterium sillae]